MKTRIGVPSTTFCWPLRTRLQRESTLDVQVGTLTDVAWKLRRREIDAGFVSPIEYARESSEYRIILGPAVSSRTSVGLYFRKGLRSINTLAADPAFACEIVLAKIVLAEEFDLSPAIVPVMGTLDHMLARADAALLAGDPLLVESSSHPNSIDLAELWSEMVDLPYVHGFFSARQGAVAREDIVRIAEVTRIADAHLDRDMMSERPENTAAISQVAVDEYLGQFSYEFSEEVEDGLREFIHYAHSHGVFGDIPDVIFYEPNSSWDSESRFRNSLN